MKIIFGLFKNLIETFQEIYEILRSDNIYQIAATKLSKT